MRDECLLIIVTYNQLSYTKACVESIRCHTGVAHRILVVDNVSTDGTREYLSALRDSGEIDVIFNSENKNWVGGVNQGVAVALEQGYRYACIMNNDLVVYPQWLERMVAVAESDERIGIVNPSWELPRRKTEDVAGWVRRCIEPRGTAWTEQDWVRGFCYLVKREVLEAIGGLDEAFAPGYYDDKDFSVRALRKGYLTVRADGAFVDHVENRTFTTQQRERLLAEKRTVFETRWGKSLNLFVALSPTDQDSDGRVREYLLVLLRDQNRLTCIETEPEFAPRHTECRVTGVPGMLAYPALITALLDNRRHSKKKHYDLILATPAMLRRLNSLPWLKGCYRILDITDETACRREIRVCKQIRHQEI
jgi:GT2 family glycosyltransferase